MVDLPLKMENISQWLESTTLIYWLPGVIFAFILIFLQGRFKHGAALILAFLVGIGIFHFAGWITGTSPLEMA